MEIAFLGSSSSGNSTVICNSDTKILVDAGLSAREIERRIELLGHSPSEIEAILLTHEHSDHCKGAGKFARRYDIPVMANPPTFAMSPIGEVDFREFMTLAEFDVGSFKVRSYPVPHNAVEPVCFTICDNKHSIGYATDLGKVTKMVASVLYDKDFLAIEANHDEEMLHSGSYPDFLKKSISSTNGHLSNRASASAICELVTERTKGVALIHLSEENNTPEKAEHEVRLSLARKLKVKNIHVAERFKTSPVIKLD